MSLRLNGSGHTHFPARGAPVWLISLNSASLDSELNEPHWFEPQLVILSPTRGQSALNKQTAKLAILNPCTNITGNCSRDRANTRELVTWLGDTCLRLG